MQIYGFDFQATKYVRVWKDVIVLADVEASTVDTWEVPETKLFQTEGDVQNANGKPTGTVVSFLQEISNVPIYDRLYLGGSNNLRGFRFRDIGPKDSNSQPIGGQSLARATVEVSFPIIEKARGAFFYDCGFVNPGAWDFSPDTIDIPRGNGAIATMLHNQFGLPGPVPPGLGTSSNPAPLSLVNQISPRSSFDAFASDFGFGLRLDLPIGPLRLDYGWPIDEAGNSKHGHLNFSVGYQF